MSDPFDGFKAAQREGWSHFAPLAVFTVPAAARLVSFARVAAGARVLDVACGTGVVAVTAARRGARASGADLTPALLEHARENAALAGVEVDFREADVESLPYEDASFDVVLSQFGHMFAPRPEVAVREMLRVLRPGGTIAFSTWPPELCVGRMLALAGRYLPPPPAGVSSPALWGDPRVVRERLGDAVDALAFDTARIHIHALSPQHHRAATERTAGPVIALVARLAKEDPDRLERFRREYDAMVAEYLEDNRVRQDYLMARAVKR